MMNYHLTCCIGLILLLHCTAIGFYTILYTTQASGAEVLKQVAKLSSHISRKDAVRTLNRMRKDKTHRDCFTNSLPVFLLVHQLLADYRLVHLFSGPHYTH